MAQSKGSSSKSFSRTHAFISPVATIITVAAALLATNCASITPDQVTVKWVRVSAEDINKICKANDPVPIVIGKYRACSTWSRDAKTCTIWAPDFVINEREKMASLGHELKHCFDGGWH